MICQTVSLSTRSATIDVDGLKLNIGIAHGLHNARKLLEDIKAGKSQFHAIEIMACPGGCIDGAGQPLHHGNSGIIKAHGEASHHAPEAQVPDQRMLGHSLLRAWRGS